MEDQSLAGGAGVDALFQQDEGGSRYMGPGGVNFDDPDDAAFAGRTWHCWTPPAARSPTPARDAAAPPVSRR